MLPPILIIHGACSQASHMEPWVTYFRNAGFEVAAPSLPGHGPSNPGVLAGTSLADYVAAVGEVHARFAEPPVVIGHSMGGLIAQHLAATADCAGVVLVSSVPPFALTARLKAVRYALPFVFPVLTRKPFRPSRSGLIKLALHDLSVAEREELLADFSSESGQAFRSMVFGMSGLPASAVRCPVLCVSGTADRLIPQRVYRKLAKRYQADEVIIPGRGHWLMAGSLVPIVAARVQAWIATLSKRRPQILESASPFPSDGQRRISAANS
jgi:pimeloyl-ACP methyl ester carboxylesterase